MPKRRFPPSRIAEETTRLLHCGYSEFGTGGLGNSFHYDRPWRRAVRRDLFEAEAGARQLAVIGGGKPCGLLVLRAHLP